MYALLARALVAAAPVPLAGRLVLDLGAGTGVAGQAALAAGARQVVAADLSEGMLRRGGGAAGTRSRPTRPRCRSVTAASTWCWPRSASTTWAASPRAWPRPGGSARRSPPACSRRAGPIRPRRRWMRPSARSATGRRPGTRPWRPGRGPATRRCSPSCAAAAGFTRVRARTTAVPTGLATPAQLASWRLGMAHVAPFLRSLDAPGRAAVRRAADRPWPPWPEPGRWSSPWWCSPAS